MATYVNDLRLKEIATGDESGSWGTSTNTNLELIGEALSFGTEGITTNADTHTTTVADGAADPGRAMYLKYTGTLDSACTITIAPNTISRMQFIENGTSGSQNIIISQGTGANITIPPGDTKAVYLDGAGSGAAVVDAFASLSTVDLKVQDDLTVTDDASIGGDATITGTLGVSGLLTANANLTLAGTTPTLTIGDAGAEDTKIVFDGNAQDFYIALDDSADDLLVGLGSTVGTTPIISITEAGAVTLKNVGTGDDNPMALTLQTSETDIAADDVLGKISFQAPDEGTGTDAILVAAAIQAISEGDFSSSSNATSLAFMTGASEAATTKMTLTSGGNLGLGVTSPEALFEIEDGGTSKDILQKITLDNDDVYGLVVGNDSYSTTSADGLAVTVTNAGIVGLQARGTSSQLAFRTVGTERARFTADGTLVIHDTTALANTTIDVRDVDNVTSFNVQNNSAGIQRSQDATAAPTLVFNKARGSLGSEANTNNGDFLGSINFRGYHTNGFYSGATIEAKISGTHGTSDMPSDLIFSVSPDGSSTPVEAFGIKTDDTCHVGVTTNGARLGGAKLNIFQSSTSVTALNIRTGRASGGIGRAVSFHENANEFGNEVGSIVTNGSSTIYATSSDYRLKENVDYTWDATTRLKQLKPARFNFIADNTNTLVDGFLAHEVSSIIPEAIIGEKDAVDSDGNPEHQGIDQSKLVPLLVKTIQELEARVTTLEG